MILKKPEFWDKKISIYSIILFPLTIILLFIIFIKKKIIKPKKYDIPIICVGNIYVGGTGKTPTSIFLSKMLSALGKSPVIIRKFYKNHIDEYDLITANSCKLILNKNRVNGVKKAEKLNHDCVILDDGFQDCKIKKNLNIICFNSNQLVGNGLVLPSGPLREGLKSLKEAQVVIINGEKNRDFEKKILNINNKLKIFYSKFKPTNLKKFKNRNLLSVAAIGNPINFFKLVKKNKLNVKKQLIYPDHFIFNKNEVQKILKEAHNIGCNIITTEKDFFKLKKYKIKNLNYLKVSLEIENKNDLMRIIKKSL